MSKQNRKTVLLAILVVGLCLRPGLTGIGSLLRLIKPDTGLSDTAAGLLTTIPLLTFAVTSPLTWRLNQRIGTLGTVIGAFGVIAVGILLRSFGGMGGLFAGTLLIGVGIALGNVMMPAIVKLEFPEKYGFVTALNSVALAISSGIASGINYPIAAAGAGWRNTLCIWAVVACVGGAAWILGGRRVSLKTKCSAIASFKLLLSSKVAWAVTLFLGIVALLFYSCASWLSTILQAKGLDAATAGYYVSAFQLTGIASSFFVPLLAGRRRDQRGITYAVIICFLAGILLLALTTAPGVMLFSVLLAGVGCNGGFALSMGFIGFRAKDAEAAAGLSAMSQSIGYVIAALGPLGMGWIFGLCGDWTINLWIMIGLLIILLGISTVAAKDSSVG